MKWIILACSMLLTFVGFSQDAVFSTFHVNPVYLNAGSYGMFDGNVRLSAVYRNQWRNTGANFNTIHVAADGKVVNFRNNSFLGFAVQGMSDRAGDLNFSSTAFSAGLNYAVSLNRYKMHWVSFGIRAGMLQQALDFSGVNEEFDPGDPNFGQGGTSELSLDVGAGMLYYVEATEKVKMYAGFSADHIGRPTLDLAVVGGADEELEVRFTTLAGFDFRLTDKFSILPSVLSVYQQPHNQIQFGSYAKVDVGSGYQSSDIALYFGSWYRMLMFSKSDNRLDALLFSARLDYKNLTTSLSYDVNISDLIEASNGYGGVEAAVQYRFKGQRNQRGTRFVGCPTF